ncbi:hypothetical protein [Sorangium sp. So ce513]|uniref:hypothetical protein n=1 Tax=Sorangium sp. So ce513 TaxID=3133315 RepID=UPI003F634B57
MSERRSQVDDFTRLTEETERLARHVEDLRLRIAATTAKRRASSGLHPAQSGASVDGTYGAPAERPQHGPPSERPQHAAPTERPPYTAPTERPQHAAFTERPPHVAFTERPPYGPPSERPQHAALTERPPHVALTERPPHAPLTERPPHGSPSERALDAVAPPERPLDAGLERAQDATAERHHDATLTATTVAERPRARHSPFPERPSCLASVSRWLPPMRPAREVFESGVHEKMGEAGRYCIVAPRQKPSSLPPKRRTTKANVA